MSLERGIVVAVADRSAGSELVGAHSSGVSTLTVYNAYDFSEDGGDLQVGDETYTYTGFDDDAATIALTGPTTAAYADGDRVLALPLSTEKTASVVMDDSGASVDVRVPHGLDPMLPEGVRAPDQQESVSMSFDGDEYVIEDVLGRVPQIDGAALSPGSVPPGAISDGFPPSSSPDAVTLGGLKQVFVKWDPIDNPDLVIYEVHVSTVSGFTPVAGDPATLATSDPSTMVSVKALPDSTPFAYDTDYFFVIIATDRDGAAAPGAEAVGRMDQTAAGDLVAGAVTAEKLEAVLGVLGTLLVGAYIEITPPGTDGGGLPTGGIVVRDPANPGGEPLVRLHPDGCTFRGAVVTDILTVMENLIVNGTAEFSAGSNLLLKNGVSDPSPGPTLTQGPIQTTWPSHGGNYQAKGICWDPTGGQWVQILHHIPTSVTYFWTISTSGVNGPLVPFSRSVSFYGGGLTFQRISGITVLGTHIYTTAVYFNSGPSTYVTILHKSLLSTGARVGEVGIGNNASLLGDSAVGTDGTSLYVTTEVVGGDVHVSKYTSALALVGSSLLTGVVGEKFRFVGVSDFGYGAAKLTVAYDQWVDVYPLPTFSGDSVSIDLALTFSLDLTTDDGGIAYKTSGSDQGYYSNHNDGKLSRWSSYYPAASEKFWVEYVDTGAGSTHTALSPVTSLAVTKRRFVSATLRPPPTGVTGAEVAVGYGSSLPPTFYKRPESLSGRVLTMTSGKDQTGPPLKTVTISNRALTSNVVTLTSNAHGYQSGQTAIMSGIPTDTFMNGTWVLTAVTTNTFSYALVHANVASAASSGSATTIPVSTLGGTPAILESQVGGLLIKGDGTVAMPKKMQTGIQTVTFASSTSQTIPVSFAVQFDVAPIIPQPSIISSSGTTSGWQIRITGVTTSGFNLVLTAAVATAWTSIPVHWVAFAP